MFIANKIGNQRYSSYADVSQLSPRAKLAQIPIKNRNSHAITSLVQKQTQIDLVKKRISALCLRDQKYTHKTLNTEIEIEKKQAIKKQSQKIQKLLEKQRKQQNQKIDLLKQRNLQSRADNYFRARYIREKRELQAKQKSQLIRNRSKQYSTTINQHKVQNIENNRQKSREIYEKSLNGKQERSRILSSKRQQIVERQTREALHLERLEEIKDHQLRQLGKLELMMVQKSNTSRAAYEASKERTLANSKYSTHRIIKTAREFNPQKINISLSLY